jgi:hypothetical protein
MTNFIYLFNHLNYFHEKLIKKTINARLSSAKTRSTKKHLPYELTEEIIRKKYKEQKGLCYYSNVQLSFHPNRDNTISPDRTNNDLGYTDNNTVLVTKSINNAKGVLTEENFLKLIEDVHKKNHPNS